MGDHSGGAGRASAVQATKFIDYQRFNNEFMAREFMDRKYKASIMTLSKDERWALEGYTDAEFEDINEYFRLNRDYVDRPAEIDYIESAFYHKHAALDDDLIAVRSFGGALNFNELKVGDVFTDKGYVSTTLDHHGLSWRSDNVEIRVPRGTRALWLEPISKHPGEAELLLDRNTTFRVVSNSGAMPLLEVIGQGVR